ncbi:MAG: hypothetical protein M1457_01380 [bacterium]|nr:hypothetical protein [bacterium]
MNIEKIGFVWSIGTMPKVKMVTICCALWFYGAAGWGCDTPVHQYALENWVPDAYVLMLLHRGSLTGEYKALADNLKISSESGQINVDFIAVDVACTTSTRQLTPFIKKFGGGPLPRMMLLRPESAELDGLIWDGPPKADTLAAMLDSPARREISRRIIDQKHAAVWVLLESGNRETDAKVAWTLSEQLAGAPKVLAEAGMLAPPGDDALMRDAATSPTLSIKFSMLRVTRTDPRERFFIKMLEMLRGPGQPGGNTDQNERGEETADVAAPMVVPIFARGRALGVLSGETITEDNILQGCALLAGPCACEIKEQNPGIDILFATDWMMAFADGITEVAEIPSLASVAKMAAAGEVGKVVGAAIMDAQDTSGAVVGAGDTIRANGSDRPARAAGGANPPITVAEPRTERMVAWGQRELLVSGACTLACLLIAAGVVGAWIRRKKI